MKRILLIASAVAIVAGCAKTQIVESESDNAISFSPVSNVNTKTVYGPVLDVNYPDGESFGVFSYFNRDVDPGKWTSDNLQNSTVYISNEEFSKDPAKNYWISDPAYYWPKEGSLVFAAYSPYKELNDNIVYDHTDGIVCNNFANPMYNQVKENNKQFDFMWFDVDLNRAVNYSSLGNLSYDRIFRHALAGVRFEVKAEDNASAGAIRIQSITLRSVSHNGNFKSLPSPTWSDQGNPSDVVVFSSTNANGESIYENTSNIYPPLVDTDKKNSVLVIPQGEKDIVIEYYIKYGADQYIPQTYNYKASGDASWSASTRYTYNITLGVDAITITPSADNWSDYGGIDVPVQ